MAKQLSLWDRPSLNPVPRVKEAMRLALKNCQLSREQVVDRMNELARIEGLSTNGKAQKITLDQVEKWVAASGDHAIPWKLLPIFCFATDDIAALAALVSPLNVTLIAQQDLSLLKWAKAEFEGRKLRKKKRLLEMEMDI